MEQQETTEGPDYETLAKLSTLKLAVQAEVYRGIIHAKDKDGMTFRQIGEAMGVAHSWVYHLYKRGKKFGY